VHRCVSGVSQSPSGRDTHCFPGRPGRLHLGKQVHSPFRRYDSAELVFSSTQTYEHASTLNGDQGKVYMFGCSAGGSLSLGTAHKLIELGRKGQMRAAINLAGGTVHEENVPAHVQHLYKSMEENATDVPIIDRQATHIINSESMIPQGVGMERSAHSRYRYCWSE
jgi:dienelactone hydrolase